VTDATDRDILIELNVRMKDMRADVAETKADVKRINGSVGRHDGEIDRLKAHVLPISQEEAARLVRMREEWDAVKSARVDMWDRVERMWSAFTIARFIALLFIVEQPIIVGLAIAILARQ